MKKINSIPATPREYRLSDMWIICLKVLCMQISIELSQQWEICRSNNSISRSIHMLHNTFAEICCHLQQFLDLNNALHLSVPNHFT